ncbi:hypothetical protein E2C01_030635 [Portunus trituberculatus]|uniref:Uncharacterized protein n=1 Tax=Portunus trituberculatus TaxID=210409 RepID=A0A5B7ERC5_PORTR|nr:hypothetical protein [Portunus trituberculatus]
MESPVASVPSAQKCGLNKRSRYWKPLFVFVDPGYEDNRNSLVTPPVRDPLSLSTINSSWILLVLHLLVLSRFDELELVKTFVTVATESGFGLKRREGRLGKQKKCVKQGQEENEEEEDEEKEKK